MKFSKEQKDYIIHALEHCEILTSGRSGGKTLELIKQQEEEIERLNQYVDFYKDLGEKQNEELESLKQINEEHQRINGELRVENERLNNIINELEHDFESYELEYLQETYQGSLADFIETELKRIQELKKGSESNE